MKASKSGKSPQPLLATQRYGSDTPPLGEEWTPFCTRPLPGFWASSRFDRMTGKIQLQMGADPSQAKAGQNLGYVFAGYQRMVNLGPRPVDAIWTSSLYTKSLSLRPKGGAIGPFGYSDLYQSRKKWSVSDRERLENGLTSQFLVRADRQQGNAFRLRVGVYFRMAYQPEQSPYGEILSFVTRVTGFGISEDQPEAQSSDPNELQEYWDHLQNSHDRSVAADWQGGAFWLNPSEEVISFEK